MLNGHGARVLVGERAYRNHPAAESPHGSVPPILSFSAQKLRFQPDEVTKAAGDGSQPGDDDV